MSTRPRWVRVLRRRRSPAGGSCGTRPRIARRRRTAERAGSRRSAPTMQGFSPNAGPLARHSLSAAELKALLAAERRGEAFLAYRDGDGAMRFFAFDEPARAAVTVGRRGEADLALRWDGEISALHAEMHSAGGEVTIVDDGLSTNGTYVNGERVAGRRRLRDGDQIRVGQTTL